MPLRSDPSLWFNLPGCVAAYQPVRAPGPLLARYNQAHGGDNRYKAVDGVAPTWSAAAGWFFGGTQYCKTGVVPASGWSAIVRFSQVGNQYTRLIGVSQAGDANPRVFIVPNAPGTGVVYSNGGQLGVSPVLTAGILAVAGGTAYRNGIAESGSMTWSGSNAYDIYIGAQNDGGTANYYINSKIQAVAIYSRTLTLAEVWAVSRQMQYCDANPDWSVWTPRRRWYFAPQAAGRLHNPVGSGVVNAGFIRGVQQ